MSVRIRKMMPEHEARKLLIEAGYTVDMHSPYRQLTILDAKYEDVKSFLIENGYAGDIIVIGKVNGKTSQKRTEEVEGSHMYPDDIQTRNRESITENNNESETIYEQLELQF